MKAKTLPILCLLFSTFYLQIEAHHISGGHIDYICSNGDDYTFNITVYRDCAGDGAQLDDPLNVTIYRQLSSGFYAHVTDEAIPLSLIEFSPIIPCSPTSSDICQEVGKYQFDYTLPAVDGSYFIVYQRCCRPTFLTNLIPSDSTGTTIYVELTPEAQFFCNTSPAFSPNTPIQICEGDSFTIDDIFATEDEDDELVYSLCAAPTGGGNLGTLDNPGNPNGCDGVLPNPACPPPYGTVPYQAGFTATAPLGNNGTIDIDSQTGVITGQANSIGDYIIGVCVSEFRNGGVLLSVSRRDFILHVAGLVSTEEVEPEAWQIYPQPASDRLYIEAPAVAARDATFDIYSSTGQLISSYDLTDPALPYIDTSHLSAGIYFYHLRKKQSMLQSGKILIIP